MHGQKQSNFWKMFGGMLVVCWPEGSNNPKVLVAQAPVEVSKPAQEMLAVEIKQTGPHRAEITVDNELLTRLDAEQYAKPILWPLLGPKQVRMSRQWPMETVPGEAHDHPHHKSLWWAHGDVNGLDFWAEKSQIKNRSIDVQGSTIALHNEWLDAERVVLTERTQLHFSGTATARWIDFDIRLIASHGRVQLGDTKEGFWAVRTHPDLRLTAAPEDGVSEVFGRAVNSEGLTDKAIWGQAASWVAYFGPVDEQPVYLLMVDHPQNFRHPTTWHARDYGLVAANPFGLHEFTKAPKGAGQHVLNPDEELRLRYRLVLGHGAWSNEIAEAFSQAW